MYTTVRGTDTNVGTRALKDIIEDAKVLFQGSPSNSDDVKDTLLKVANAYPGYDLNTLGFSLGGSYITEVFTGQDEADKRVLDRYDSIVLVNPGGSPFGDTDKIENILGQERTTLLTNRSDIISSIYSQYSDKDRTYYGPHSYNPLEAHSPEQFGSSPPEFAEAGINIDL